MNWKNQTNASFTFYQLRKKMLSIDPFEWLLSTPLYPKFYWEDRVDKYSIAATGVLASFPEITYFSPEVTLFFLKPFDTIKKGYPWENFPLEKRCFLPRFEIHSSFSDAILVQNALSPEDISFPLRQDRISLFSSSPVSLKATYPNQDKWSHQVQKALSLIKKKSLEKVVLARIKEYILPSSFCLSAYLNLLRKNRMNTFIFFYAPNEEEAFFSFSPERLYQRNQNLLKSEAIAGTNYHQKKKLHHDRKEKKEFQFVKDSLEKIFTELCKTVHFASKPTILSTQNLEHLYTPIEGILKASPIDEILIQSLHPTPATLGLPAQEALSFLLEEELFTRGYYAAPLGWIRPDQAEILVGIRSGLIRKNRFYLFSGTGLVDSSIAQNEWEELDQKLLFYENAFHAMSHY